MKYVEVDDRTGVVSWDAYFEYLRTIQKRLPAELYSYAINWEHYSLDGKNSLHDAWLIGIQFANREKEVSLELLGARHDRKLLFKYVDVQGYLLDLDVEYKRGDRDVLAHEFRIEHGVIVHDVLFSNKKSILIRAMNVIPATESLS